MSEGHIPKRPKANLIKTAFLFTGYVETLSHACLILTHRKGFKTKEALVDHLHRVFKEVVRQRGERGDPEIRDIVFEYIRGDNQSGDMDVWEALDANGWTEGPQKKFGRSITIDKAEAVFHNNNIYDSHEYFSHAKTTKDW